MTVDTEPLHNEPRNTEPTGSHTVEQLARDAVASVDDPEYPGISIVDLGLLETVAVTGDGQEVTVGLIPTFSGCPALDIIAEDVRTAVHRDLPGRAVTVEWLRAPAWTTERISPEGRAAMADRFTVAVQLGASAPTCPRCGGPTTLGSLFGPSRCRAVHRCERCREAVEVMRG